MFVILMEIQMEIQYLVISVVVGVLLIEVVAGYLVNRVIRILGVVVVSVGVVDRPSSSRRVVEGQGRPCGE